MTISAAHQSSDGPPYVYIARLSLACIYQVRLSFSSILSQYDHSLKRSRFVAGHQCKSFVQLFCRFVESSRMLKLISQSNLGCGFIVAAFVGVTYDWALTFGQEVELVWRQRWSLVTVLYLSVRYLGIFFAALTMLINVPTISLTDRVSWNMSAIWNWTGIMAFAMLWIIIITRLYAMYQRSRKILILLIVTSLASSICIGVAAVIITVHASVEEYYLSGTYQCSIGFGGDLPLLTAVMWILSTVWEVFTLCLAVWIAVKHFRELRQHPAGGIIVDCFTVLMKTHVLLLCEFCCCFLPPAHCSKIVNGMSIFRCPCVLPRFIVSIGFTGRPDLLWVSSDFGGRADVYSGTTPDPWRPRIQREARGRF
ncbi:uncharacterized protein HD556DRAFT_1527256 [Suillus plorans]|uniref:DUF6533 domain-containing protein n=1 Tax=Suillus plorans TaxID=116603 RepID=A0A9P7DIH7_9AGAM|nr:uncharacterized protein HD556DRAFT_1527256 [Suillus plorans]KAG1794190.1 hypothetical protein HD556DRAFT_1527256 [Suillus plorans]